MVPTKTFILLCLSILGVYHASQAGEYVVDAVGGDDETGQGTLASPWKSIQRAADVMEPGDVCRIRAGVYREEVKPREGGIFVNYQKERVLITGCEPVTSPWKQHSGSVYRTRLEAPVYDVFVDGDYMDKARWPDEDGEVMTKDEWVSTTAGGRGNRGTVTFAEGLPADFMGGFYTGHNGNNAYNFNHGRIVSQQGDQITCSHLNFRWKQGVRGHLGEGFGNIIDHLNCLTTEKEWHWEEGHLYLFAPGGGHPAALEVEARVRLYGFDCSGKNGVQIRGIHFKGASVLMDDSNDCVIDGCSFRYVSPWGKHYYQLGPTGGQSGINHYTVGGPVDGTAGIYLKGNNNTLQNSLIQYGWGCLVTLLGSDSTVQNNHIESANWITRQHGVNITVSGSGQKILNNTIRRSTGKMIAFILYDGVPVQGLEIRGNDCRQYAYAMYDGGTACFYTNGDDDLGGTVIAYNLIAENQTHNDRVSCGVYLDDGAHNATIHHNVIHGGGHCRSGVFTHKSNRDIRVYHNTCWGQTGAAWLSAVWEGERDFQTMVYRNNLSGGRGFGATGVDSTITQDHNREHANDSEWMDVSQNDFRISQAGAPSVDAGIPIPGINDAFHGNAPDLGAYEYGATPWKAGSTLTSENFKFQK